MNEIARTEGYDHRNMQFLCGLLFDSFLWQLYAQIGVRFEASKKLAYFPSNFTRKEKQQDLAIKLCMYVFVPDSISKVSTMIDVIQDLLKLEGLREVLSERCGGSPTFAQWAAAAGVDQRELRRRLNYDILCKDKMITSNIRLVISIAKNYQGAGMNLQDLVQVYTSLLYVAKRIKGFLYK